MIRARKVSLPRMAEELECLCSPPTMTRQHNTDNGDSSSARLTLLRCRMVNVTFVLGVSYNA